MLQIKRIKKDYPVGTSTVHAIKGISVDFRRNELVSILGPSGSGKTTLMNIIGGLDKATSGDLIIEGISTRNYTDQDWDNYRNKRVGFVFQNHNLIPHLNVYENVELALTLSGISKEERKERVLKAISDVGLSNQIKQRPNQLSGGQSQRVAIARALVNNPEILLADEPTGSLDTEISEQIMQLIEEIAKDRLVIMVTHNPDIAHRYSTRVINMLDGVILNDSKPHKISNDLEKVEKKATKEKSSMSFITALSLSFKNLFSKKGRTILTSIAGSIGIIGIALILSISGGVNKYIDNMQQETLASNPINVSYSSISIDQIMEAMEDREIFENFPVDKKVFIDKGFDPQVFQRPNNITQDYINHLGLLNNYLLNDIHYLTNQDMNFFVKRNDTGNYSKINNVLSANTPGPGFGSESSFYQMLLNNEIMNDQYDVIEGRLPENDNELVLIVNSKNQVDKEILVALGIMSESDEELTEVPFDQILDLDIRFVNNNLLYEKDNDLYKQRLAKAINYDDAVNLSIKGIIRVKESTKASIFSTGIGFTKGLYESIQDVNYSSDIINHIEANPNTNPFDGEVMLGMQKEILVRSLGGNKLANEINIYPKDFDSKEEIKVHLNEFNKDKDKDDVITYFDLSEIIGDSLSQLVNIVSSVLIAFTAISLVVSSIMIAIITYVSVLERTKEIGVLRSIGARKQDVTRIFNAETFIIGLIAGVLGIFITLLLSIPINIFGNNVLDVNGLASLSITNAITLILISVVLTLLSGLIPARKASKLDPVIALRTE